MRRGQNQYVTGLTVFDSEQPRIAKRVKRKIRQEIYFINKFGYKGHIFHILKVNEQSYENDVVVKQKVEAEILRLHTKLKGWLLFINSIEPNFSKKYSVILYSKK